ncbi:hypothetical protein GP918_32900, partial [Enterobacteriaceae bacterium 8376wD7]|nr:hypothetical protein [Enterobacteriaceae bacterium 8376wD7]
VKSSASTSTLLLPSFIVLPCGRCKRCKPEIDVEQAFSGSPKEEASRIAEVLREGDHCVVTTRPNNAVRHGIEAQCRERGLSRAAYGEHICAWLADVTAQAVALCPPGALYLSGGDVAIAVAQALGA